MLTDRRTQAKYQDYSIYYLPAIFCPLNFTFIPNCNKSNNALSIRGQNAITILPVTLQRGGWEREYNLLTFKR